MRSGRLYRVVVELLYMGDAIADDAQDALRRASRACLGDISGNVSFHKFYRHHPVVTVHATVRSENPLQAMERVNRCLDDALADTGMFEEFDVTGKVLHVSPLERAETSDQES